MIFGMFNPGKIWCENLTDLSTSPVRYCHFTLGNPKKLFSTVLFMHTSHYLCYFTRAPRTYTHTRVMALMLLQKKTNCNPLAHLTWKCHHTNFWIAKLFLSDWRFVAFFQASEAMERASCGLSLVALKRTGCDVWQLECQASNVTASVQSDHFVN